MRVDPRSQHCMPLVERTTSGMSPSDLQLGIVTNVVRLAPRTFGQVRALEARCDHIDQFRGSQRPKLQWDCRGPWSLELAATPISRARARHDDRGQLITVGHNAVAMLMQRAWFHGPHTHRHLIGDPGVGSSLRTSPADPSTTRALTSMSENACSRRRDGTPVGSPA